jgi:hypothetical protein
MLSSTLNISEFCSKVKDHTYQEIIEITDEEATEVERMGYKCGTNGDHAKIVHYVGCLKDFILYMRHGVRSKTMRDLDLSSFHQIRREH